MSEITEDKRITDVGAGICKAVVNAIPVVSFVQTVYDEYATRQWQQRREKFEEVFEEKLQDLQDEIDLIKINKIPNFAQILSQATQGAMSDIEEDKIKFYINVAINAIKVAINAIKTEKLEDTKTHIFLNMLRNFSVLHIKVLQHIKDFKSKYAFSLNQPVMREKETELLKSIESIYNDKEVIASILNGLNKETLIYGSPNIRSGNIIPQSISNLGIEFLNFISDCEEKDE